ncbi:beta-1,4-D-glucan cellobiohydrolase [Ceratobasidium sp. AG-Ba]|nr:beta-1,4-D-glucan cellobiohydrolase [Ceratobasidium sp. AG-Ba]
MNLLFVLCFVFFIRVHGQQAGTQTTETHPSLTWQKCTKSAGCVTQSQGKIVLDANRRWIHSASGYTNCYTGQKWDPRICPDPQTCAKNCAIDGADYSGTYGVSTSGNSITLKYVKESLDTRDNYGSRVFLLANDSIYQIFKLKNQEFTFDVDASKVPCELNGALYFTEMAADGGMSRYPGNKAGAKYGTGYCSARCPKDLKFINGEVYGLFRYHISLLKKRFQANLLGWTGSSTDPNSGTGLYGACCNEVAIWEANSVSAVYTSRPCNVTGQTRCSGSDCSSGYCDAVGCDFNSYRMGNRAFYGEGRTVDTTKKLTVITRFITADGTSTGSLSEIRRIYVQDGKVIQNSKTNITGMASYDSVSEPFCAAQKAAFGDPNVFTSKGGLSSISNALDKGMVLVMSIWQDYETRMLWLDGTYHLDGSGYGPGDYRGTCPSYGGTNPPGGIEPDGGPFPVQFSNIRFGEIGSTVTGV